MNKAPSILRKSRMPLYLQVATLMRQQIEKQRWRYGEQIPTLDELEQEYKVSRITLRAALSQLEEQQIIRRTRGLGTFVAKDLSRQRWFQLPNNLDQLVDAVADLKIRLLPVGPTTPALAPPFESGNAAPAYQRLKRVHYHEDIPYCLIDIYLDKEVFDGDPAGFSNKPVIPQLAARPDMDSARARQILRITLADEDTAAHLDIGVGDPVADVSRALWNNQERIIYYAHIQYPAQMIYLDVDLMQGTRKSRKPSPKRKA